MKWPLLIVLSLLVLSAWARDPGVADFNKILLEKVQKDINDDNDEDLKVKSPPGRGPASVSPVEVEKEIVKPEQKIDRLKQLGTSQW
jgi:hypothetical protein